MYSWAIRSSSSVVTPGATALPASWSAPAAIRPATRIFSITSGVCTHGSLPSRTVDFHAYSGRGMRPGTGRVGDNSPGESAVRAGMPTSLITLRGAGSAGDQPKRPRINERRGPRIVTEPHTTRPVNTTCGRPSPGASLRRSLALPT